MRRKVLRNHRSLQLLRIQPFGKYRQAPIAWLWQPDFDKCNQRTEEDWRGEASMASWSIYREWFVAHLSVASRGWGWNATTADASCAKNSLSRDKYGYHIPTFRQLQLCNIITSAIWHNTNIKNSVGELQSQMELFCSAFRPPRPPFRAKNPEFSIEAEHQLRSPFESGAVRFKKRFKHGHFGMAVGICWNGGKFWVRLVFHEFLQLEPEPHVHDSCARFELEAVHFHGVGICVRYSLLFGYGTCSFPWYSQSFGAWTSHFLGLSSCWMFLLRLYHQCYCDCCWRISCEPLLSLILLNSFATVVFFLLLCLLSSLIRLQLSHISKNKTITES